MVRSAAQQAIAIARANSGMPPIGKRGKVKAPTALQMMRAKEILKRAKDNDLQIKNKSDDDNSDVSDEDEEETTDKGIPDIKFPSSILFVGKKFAGKTNFIKAMIEPRVGEFDNIFLFTITKHKNNLNHLASDEKMIMEAVSEEFFDMLLEHQVETDANTLLIFDDIVGMKGLIKQAPIIRKLAASGRNFNISIIFSTQDMVEIATTFRRNAEYIFLGNNSGDENELIAKQLAPPHLGKRRFLDQLTMIAKKKKHQFFFIDVEERDFDIVVAPKVL